MDKQIPNKYEAYSPKTEHINKKLNSLLSLSYTYNTKNSQEIADELKRTQTDKQMKIITLDITDLFVNLPIQGILTTTKF